VKHARSDVLAAVQALFPLSWESVLAQLDTYGVESYEHERERVQLAVLELGEGNEDKTRGYLAAAKDDYRDVLYWAEHPEQSSLDSPERRVRMRRLLEKLRANRRKI
jgi:hypothetical protein